MKQCRCGHQVANNARTCPNCGHRFTGALAQAIAVLLGISFLMIVIAVSLNSKKDSVPTPSQQSIPSASRNVSTGNVANDILAKLPAPEQAAYLGKVTNEGCLGKRAFYMGTSPADNSALWSVGCKNGKSYVVQINADASGSTKVLECGLYKAVTKMNCFTKLSN
jgi:hypothetical protein